MTEPLFLDTDCISTFLIVHRENLILQLYAGCIGIPQQVFNLKHCTSADIMVEALEQHLISEGQGNVIWRDMLQRNRKLPAESFTEFLASRK